MRLRPTAFAWIDPEVSTSPDRDRAHICRLAKRLGYEVLWASDASLIPLFDQVRQADVDAVLVPSPTHLDVITLTALREIADVESVIPRLSFDRWAAESRDRGFA